MKKAGYFILTTFVLAIFAFSFVSAAGSTSDPFARLADLANSGVKGVVTVLIQF